MVHLQTTSVWIYNLIIKSQHYIDVFSSTRQAPVCSTSKQSFRRWWVVCISQMKRVCWLSRVWSDTQLAAPCAKRLGQRPCQCPTMSSHVCCQSPSTCLWGRDRCVSVTSPQTPCSCNYRAVRKFSTSQRVWKLCRPRLAGHCKTSFSCKVFFSCFLEYNSVIKMHYDLRYYVLFP